MSEKHSRPNDHVRELSKELKALLTGTPIEFWKRSDIKPDPKNVRKEFNSAAIQDLATSIKAIGILHPLIIEQSGQIVCGENRWRAAQIAGLTTLPVKVIKGLTDDDRHLVQLHENINSIPMSQWDIADSIKALMESRTPPFTQQELIKITGLPIHAIRSATATQVLREEFIGELKKNRTAISTNAIVRLAAFQTGEEKGRFPEGTAKRYAELIKDEKTRPSDDVMKGVVTYLTAQPGMALEVLNLPLHKMHRSDLEVALENLAPSPSTQIGTNNGRTKRLLSALRHTRMYLNKYKEIQPGKGSSDILEEMQLLGEVLPKAYALFKERGTKVDRHLQRNMRRRGMLKE